MKLLLLFTIFVILAATIIANLGDPFGWLSFVERIPGKDMTGHFLLYQMLGLTLSFFLRTTSFNGIRSHALMVLIGVALLVTGEELSQVFFENRSFSFTDLSASLMGLASGAYAAWIFAPRHSEEG